MSNFSLSTEPVSVMAPEMCFVFTTSPFFCQSHNAKKARMVCTKLYLASAQLLIPQGPIGPAEQALTHPNSVLI